MNNDEVLKPCPYCGKVPELESRLKETEFAIGCDTPYCMVTTTNWRTKEEAIELWNHRTP